MADDITRAEFEQQNDAIFRAIGALTDAISQESAARKAESAELRADLRAGAETTQSHLASLAETTQAQLSTLAENLSAKTKSPVGALAAWAGVVIVLLTSFFGAIGSGYVREQTRAIEVETERHAANVAEHQTLRSDSRADHLQLKDDICELMNTRIEMLKEAILTAKVGVDASQDERIRALERDTFKTGE